MHVGPLRHDCVRHPWRRWFPTWRGMGVGRLKSARLIRWKVSKGGMESNGAPLMAPSRCGRSRFNEGVCEDQGYCALGVLIQALVDRVVVLQFRSPKSKEMAGCSPLSREGSREGCHCSRCAGGQGAGSTEKEVVENQGMGSRDENLGER